MRRALLWVTSQSWEAVVDAGRSVLPTETEIVLLAIEPSDAEELAHGAAAGLLGRRPRHPPPHEAIHAAALRAGAEVIAAARERLGRPAEAIERAGRAEHEVVAAADGFDVLVVARDGDPRHPGPRSLGPATRFAVDHAPCAVLLVYAPAR